MPLLTPASIKRFRGGTDALRGTLALARNLRYPGRYALARRAAAAMQPPPGVAIDADQGFRIFPPGTFPEAGEVVATCTDVLKAVLAESSAEQRVKKGRKRFLINLLDPATLDERHPIVRLALRADLLAAIAAYMGTIPVLRSIQLFYSGAYDREPISSQLYHCDADDRRQVKIFVMCSDVRAENGPLTVLDAARSRTVRRATRYHYHSRLTDQQVEAIVGAAPPTAIVGPPETMSLIDTSRCFHFGSRVTPGAAPRLVTMVQFLHPTAFVLPGDYRSGALLPRLALDGLSPLQRAVATGDHTHLRG